MKLLIADDHPLVRRALSLTMERVGSVTRILEAESLPAALDLLRSHPDVELFLMDLSMPGISGLDGLEAALAAARGVPVAVVSADERAETAVGALGRGAVGYLPKSLPEDVMRAALSLILAGGIYVPPLVAADAFQRMLQREHGAANQGRPGGAGNPAPAARAALTARQREVLELVIEGLSNKEIAEHLGLSEATVKVHITAILRVYGVNNRAKAISAARREANPAGA